MVFFLIFFLFTSMNHLKMNLWITTIRIILEQIANKYGLKVDDEKKNQTRRVTSSSHTIFFFHKNSIYAHTWSSKIINPKKMMAIWFFIYKYDDHHRYDMIKVWTYWSKHEPLFYVTLVHYYFGKKKKKTQDNVINYEWHDCIIFCYWQLFYGRKETIFMDLVYSREW